MRAVKGCVFIALATPAGFLGDSWLVGQKSIRANLHMRHGGKQEPVEIRERGAGAGPPKAGSSGVIVNPELLVWGRQQQVFLDLHLKAVGECNPATWGLGERCQLASCPSPHGYRAATAWPLCHRLGSCSFHSLPVSLVHCGPSACPRPPDPCSFSFCSFLCCSFRISLFRFWGGPGGLAGRAEPGPLRPLPSRAVGVEATGTETIGPAHRAQIFSL